MPTKHTVGFGTKAPLTNNIPSNCFFFVLFLRFLEELGLPQKIRPDSTQSPLHDDDVIGPCPFLVSGLDGFSTMACNSSPFLMLLRDA